jgi:hypothetical protein
MFLPNVFGDLRIKLEHCGNNVDHKLSNNFCKQGTHMHRYKKEGNPITNVTNKDGIKKNGKNY